jgi:hypothetical protein
MIHEFDPLIYPRNIWITVGNSVEEIKREFKFSSDDEKYFSQNIGKDSAIGFKVIQRSTGYKGILMSFRDKKSMTVGTIAHESVHIADYLYEESGAYSQVLSEKNEPYAYLVGWIADCIYKLKNNKCCLY